jgi:hypothetical protein
MRTGVTSISVAGQQQTVACDDVHCGELFELHAMFEGFRDPPSTTNASDHHSLMARLGH